MFGSIKRYAGKRALNKQRKLIRCKRHFHNFTTAKTIALLYPYNLALDNDITQFIKFLTDRQIKVRTLGYTAGSSIPQTFLTTANKSLFTKAQLNWFRKPVAKELTDFMAEPFDMLIDFSSAELFPLHYITTLSQAAMRVGRLNYPDNPYEFILSVPADKDAKFYIEQLKHYLQSFQTK